MSVAVSVCFFADISADLSVAWSSSVATASFAASPVSVRQVVENALYAGASSIILAHNHPSGVALPSQQDLLVTRQIQEALSPLNIRLADHVVVADSDYVSMAESGLLAR